MTEKDLRIQFAARMRRMNGAVQGDLTHKWIVDTYNSFTPRPRGYKLTTKDAWCSATPSAVSIELGLTDTIPVECSCSALVALYQAMGRWVEDDNHLPQVGDLCFYDWGDDGKGDCLGAPEHVGTVVAVVGELFYVCEGNMGNQHTVGERQMKRGGRYIRGFGCPDYASAAKRMTPEKVNVKLPLLCKGSTGDAVRAMQLLLLLRGYDTGHIDTRFDAETDKWFRRFQSDNALEVDGLCGVQSWAALVGC